MAYAMCPGRCGTVIGDLTRATRHPAEGTSMDSWNPVQMPHSIHDHIYAAMVSDADHYLVAFPVCIAPTTPMPLHNSQHVDAANDFIVLRTAKGRIAVGRPRVDPKIAKQRMIERRCWPVSRMPEVKPTNSPWPCRCMDCGSFITPRYNGVVNRGQGGCDPCARKTQAQKRRVPDEIAVAEMRAAKVDPIEKKCPGVSEPWPSICMNPECPGIWFGKPTEIAPRLVDARRSKGTACKYCAGKAVHPYVARLQMIRRASVMPLEPFPGANKRWECVCLRSGHITYPAYSNVVGGRSTCERCARNFPYTEFEARAIANRCGFRADSDERYINTSTSWPGICVRKGHPCAPRLANLIAGQGPCHFCAKRGYKTDLPGTVYLLINSELKALKIGIYNDTKRLKRHLGRGWRLLRSRDYFNGQHALDVEGCIKILWFDELGFKLGCAREHVPQGGYTETISLLDVTEVEAISQFEFFSSRVSTIRDSKQLISLVHDAAKRFTVNNGISALR